METSNDFNDETEEERRRGGLYKLARALHLPKKFLKDQASWKRTRAVMVAIITLFTVGPATAFTISKKATPIENIQVASIVPTALQPATPKSSTDANLPTYFRVVDSGEFCPDQDAKIKVMVENPDIVPGHPKLTDLLKTSPCFNFGWFENNGKTAVINYIPHNSGVLNSRHIEKDYVLTKDNGAFRMYAAAVDPEFNRFMEALVLDATRRISGPNIENYYAKKMEDLKKQGGNEANHYNYAFEIVFFDSLKRVARSEGLSIRLSDATREREAADKLPGDFLIPDGTADRYKMILARMSPSDWEKFRMGISFAEVEKNADLGKHAYSYLRNPGDIKFAQEHIKKFLPTIADQILTS